MRWDPADPAAVRACYDVQRAALAQDDPAGPPVSERRLRGWLEWSVEPTETWFVPAERPGSGHGFCRLGLPDLENLDRAIVFLVVHPAVRRRGLGTRLLWHAAERAAANQRRMLSAIALRGSPGSAFARRAGARPGIVEARRVLRVGAVPGAFAAALRQAATPAAAGYSLICWTGATPSDRLGQVASVFNALNDAPREEGHERRTWDARLIRERIAPIPDLLGSRSYSVAALHDASGEMAALTQLELDPEYPQWAQQGITAVTRPHRGHRLGMLVKAAMMQWLAEAEPELQRIQTGNAASNDHMIAINDALGFEVLEPAWQLYDLPVETALAGN